jgi:hypothetical protein
VQIPEGGSGLADTGSGSLQPAFRDQVLTFLFLQIQRKEKTLEKDAHWYLNNSLYDHTSHHAFTIILDLLRPRHDMFLPFRNHTIDGAWQSCIDGKGLVVGSWMG